MSIEHLPQSPPPHEHHLNEAHHALHTEAHHALHHEAMNAGAPGAHVQHGHLSPHSRLTESENKIEDIVKHDPKHEHLSQVYKELDGLRHDDKAHFGKDLEHINKKLHHDGLLPGLTIIQDRYTGQDKKDHHGYSIIADDSHNPGHRMGSEVSSNHPVVHETPKSHSMYHAINHGHHGGYEPSRDSAGEGRAAQGGYDQHLRGQTIPKGEHKELIDKMLETAGVPVNAATEAAMNKIITRESSWNTNAVNRWDKNARNGDPSKGLMQVIHSTFERYRDKSLPDSQTDPIANGVAALHYMGARYGHGSAEAGLLHVASRSGGY